MVYGLFFFFQRYRSTNGTCLESYPQNQPPYGNDVLSIVTCTVILQSEAARCHHQESHQVLPIDDFPNELIVEHADVRGR